MPTPTTDKVTITKPRNIDPAILQLRQEHAERVAALRHTKQSAALLTNITTKLLPRLTPADLATLKDTVNAPLPAEVPPPAPAAPEAAPPLPTLPPPLAN